jgi:hypothetical protein
MSLIVKDTGSDFIRPATGLVQAVCTQVFDIGLQHTTYKGVEKLTHQCIVMWELAERITDGEYAGKRFVVSKFYTASLSDRAHLRKDLVSWRGRDFSPVELEGFELENIRSANCYLNLVERKKANGDSAVVVDAIVPFKRKDGGDELMTPELPIDYMPDWVKKQIEKSVKDTPMAAQIDTSDIEANDVIPF